MPPSKLAIATSSVKRLVKEEKSYEKEIIAAKRRIKNLEEGDEKEITASSLDQERKAVEETHKMLPTLRQRLLDAMGKLKQELDAGSSEPEEEVTKAKEALGEAENSIPDKL